MSLPRSMVTWGSSRWRRMRGSRFTSMADRFVIEGCTPALKMYPTGYKIG